MKKSALVLLVVLLGLAGCAHQYVMTLTNGNRITAASKPTLKDGIYYYKDVSGRDGSVSAGRVRELAPASMVKEEKSRFSGPPGK